EGAREVKRRKCPRFGNHGQTRTLTRAQRSFSTNTGRMRRVHEAVAAACCVFRTRIFTPQGKILAPIRVSTVECVHSLIENNVAYELYAAHATDSRHGPCRPEDRFVPCRVHDVVRTA